MKRTISILSAALLLAGCQSIPVGTRLPDMPASLLSGCADPSNLPEKFDLRDVLMANADNREALKACATRHKALSDWVRNLY